MDLLPFIRRELPGLLDIADVLCDFFTYHFEHAVFVLPAGSAQKGPIRLFNDLNEFHVGNVNIGWLIIRRHIGSKERGLEAKWNRERETGRDI